MHFFPAVGGFAIFLNHMPVDKQIIHHLRPQGIRSDIPVSQAYHQNRLFFFNLRDQPAQLLCQLLGNFPVIILIRLYQCRRFQCDIGTHRFPHGFCSVFSINNDTGNLHLALLTPGLLHPYPPQLSVRIRNTFPGFQRQVRSYLKTTHLYSPAFPFLYFDYSCYGNSSDSSELIRNDYFLQK